MITVYYRTTNDGWLHVGGMFFSRWEVYLRVIYISNLLDMMGGMITIDGGRTKISVLILARKKKLSDKWVN